MNNLLSLSFWLNFRPGDLIPVNQKIFIGLLILFFLLGVILKVTAKKKKNIYRTILAKLSTLFFTNTFIGLVLLFFIYERVSFLSARFWLLVWAIGMIVWLYFILKNIKEIPKKREEREKKEEFEKYIP